MDREDIKRRNKKLKAMFPGDPCQACGEKDGRIAELEAERDEVLDSWRIQTEALNETMAELLRIQEAAKPVVASGYELFTLGNVLLLSRLAKELEDE